MADEFESGFMVHTPSWHRKENAVLKDSPRSWEEARKQALLEWDVTTRPAYDREPVIADCEHFISSEQCEQCPTEITDWIYYPIEGYQQLRRDDTDALLSVQKSSYEVIPNAAFGGLIDAVLGLEDDERVTFESLMSLYEGRQIIALCYFPIPLKMPWDNSPTYTFCAFSSRHDGQGGLRGLPTNVRVVCANTFNIAEMTDGRTTGFTIRHTSNWDERIAQVRQVMVTARGQGHKWEEFSEQLARWEVNTRRREDYLKRLFPVSDDNGPRKNDNQLSNRQAVRTILESPTCEQIKGNGYGLLMATSEWNDHYRQSQNVDTYVARQLMRIEEAKSKGARILRHMADIRV